MSLKPVCRQNGHPKLLDVPPYDLLVDGLDLLPLLVAELVVEKGGPQDHFAI